MTFEELKPLLEELTPTDLQQLRDYLDQETASSKAHPLSAEERIRRLDEAAAAIREGMSEEELDEMIAAMNEDYIEAVDDSLWED